MDEEAKALMPAPLAANRFYVSRLDDGSLRLAFGEAMNGAVKYHQAVRLSADDAEALRAMLATIYPPTPQAEAAPPD